MMQTRFTTIRHSGSSTPSRRSTVSRRAFTIVELLASILIITFIMAITVVTLSTTNRMGSLDSGVNEVSASLAFARSIAMRDGVDAGVVFFRDANTDNILMRIVKRNSDTTTGTIGFADVDDRPPTRLPPWVQVAGIDLNNSTSTWVSPDYFNFTPNTPTDTVTGYVATAWYTGGPAGTGKYLLVWFGPTGALQTSTSAISSPSFSHGSPSYYYDTTPGNGAYTNTVKPAAETSAMTGTPPPSGVLVPVPYIAMYDYRDAVEGTKIQKPNFAQISDWISGYIPGATHTAANAIDTKARILLFNRYTGQLIRSK
jgi:Tfp pilus assembly protein FimT